MHELSVYLGGNVTKKVYVQDGNMTGRVAVLYLDDFEPFLVVLRDFVSSDKLDVAAVARVAHDVVLKKKKSIFERKHSFKN